MEYCTENLMNVIRNNADNLGDNHIKVIVYEILKGVSFIHS